MEINALPKYDMTDNPTNCCPRFKEDGWDRRELHFRDKLFVRANTKSIFHIPLNIGSVFSKTFKAIEESGAKDDDDFIVLSHDSSAWASEHYFSVSREVPDQTMVRMEGDYWTRVFEGPYKYMSLWEKEIDSFVQRRGKQVKKTYFFYTTCPKCAKFYGKNYVVGVAEVQ